MKQATEIQVEDMITARMRRDDPDLERTPAWRKPRTVGAATGLADERRASPHEEGAR